MGTSKSALAIESRLSEVLICVVVVLAGCTVLPAGSGGCGAAAEGGDEDMSPDKPSVKGDPERQEIAITAEQSRVIDVALREFNRMVRGGVAGQYIIVSRRDGRYLVTFDDPERRPGMLGSSPRIPTVEVTIDPDFAVVSAHFVK